MCTLCRYMYNNVVRLHISNMQMKNVHTLYCIVNRLVFCVYVHIMNTYYPFLQIISKDNLFYLTEDLHYFCKIIDICTKIFCTGLEKLPKKHFVCVGSNNTKSFFANVFNKTVLYSTNLFLKLSGSFLDQYQRFFVYLFLVIFPLKLQKSSRSYKCSLPVSLTPGKFGRRCH
jgi:hypothetical protein